jgi:hypothetical protein
MSNYNLKERFLAKILSKTPRIKRVIKFLYVYLNSIIYKKEFTNLILNPNIKSINSVVELKGCEESFFGYYDKFPMNKNGWVISNITSYSTLKKPSSKVCININLTNINTKESVFVGETNSYNWQQGARAHWLNNEELIFNFFDKKQNKYCSKVFSIKLRKITKVIDLPVQDSCNRYFLSIDYERLMISSPDYGYRNKLSFIANDQKYLRNDGIFIHNFKENKSKLLYSFNDVLEIGFIPEFKNAIHTINHIMINPNGNSFIFIHRYYLNNVRYDRLLFSDFKKIKVLFNHNMVSHCCWLDENNIFGYLRYKEVDGYYNCNVKTGEISKNKVMTDLGMGDGHPSSSSNFIVFDCYPDKARMQKLIKYNSSDNSLTEILELFNPLKYREELRCDLHPRFNDKEDIIFFDSVFEGKRKHYYIKLN